MKTFVCSLCHKGLLGGALYLDGHSLTYRTNKLTVDETYRNLVMPLQQIKAISWKRRLFPFATVTMENAQSDTFLIFNRARFEKWFEEYRR